MRHRQAVKLAVQVAVSVLLVALLLWKIDFKDSVSLASGEKVRGRILAPTKRDKTVSEVHIEVRSGEVRVYLPAQLKTPDRPDRSVQFGFLSSIRDIDVFWFSLGTLITGLLAITTGYRWQLLLRVQGVHAGLWRCIKLTMVGFCFDNVMPGATGGDVVKAYYIARDTHRKAEAVVSVFVDRVVGLLDLATISAVALLFLPPGEGFKATVWIVAIFFAATTVGAVVFYSRRVRRVIRLDAILRKLPFQKVVQRCDQAMFVYRYHKMAVLWAFLLSVVTQVVAVVAVYFIGIGLGIQASIGAYFVYFPVIMMVSAAPVTPAGLGLREWAFTFFFGLAGVPAGMGCALAVIYRVTRLIWSVPGIVFAWTHRRVSAAAMESELQEVSSVECQVSSDDPESRVS